MFGSMADIQSATAKIRRVKTEEDRKKIEETTGQKYNGLPYYIGGHNNFYSVTLFCGVSNIFG